MENNRKSLENLIDRLDRQINMMHEKAGQIQEDARDDYNRRIDDLKSQRREAKQQLDKLQESGREAADDLKSGAQQAWDDVKDAVNNAIARFK